MHHDSCRQKASYDGSTIIARDDDSGSGRYDPKRFVAIAPEVSTDNLYWTNRLIAALADAHFYETSNAIEAFAEAARTYSHRLVEHTDAALRNIGKNSDDSAIGDSVAETAGGRLPGGCRRPTTRWRNTCVRMPRNCSTTCCTRPAILCATVSRCRIAGTEPAVRRIGSGFGRLS